MLLKTQGVVVKAVNLGETDKIVTLLSKEYGKIQAVAKGARRTRSRLMAGTQLFCYGDFLLFKGRNWNYIDQLEIIDTFYKIRNDLLRLSYGSYILELISEVVQPEQPCRRLFRLAIDALEMLTAGKGDPEVILRACELKAMDYAGYRPNLDKCALCQSTKTACYFSPSSGGVLCSECRQDNIHWYRVSPGTIEVMKTLLKMDLSRVSNLKVGRSILKELEDVMRAFVAIHLDKDFSTVKFIDNIKKLNRKGGV